MHVYDRKPQDRCGCRHGIPSAFDMSGLATMAGAQSLAQPPSAPAPIMRWSTSMPGPRLSHPATEGAGPCEPPCRKAAPTGRQRAADAARSHSRLLAGLTATQSIGGGGGGGNAAAGAQGGGAKAGGPRAGGSLIDRLASAVECGRTPPPAPPAPPAARAALDPVTPYQQRGASAAGPAPPRAAASQAAPSEAARPAPDAPPRPARQSPPKRAARAADPALQPDAPPKETPAEYMARLKQELDPDAFARVEELLRAFRKARWR